MHGSAQVYTNTDTYRFQHLEAVLMMGKLLNLSNLKGKMQIKEESSLRQFFICLPRTLIFLNTLAAALTLSHVYPEV